MFFQVLREDREIGATDRREKLETWTMDVSWPLAFSDQKVSSVPFEELVLLPYFPLTLQCHLYAQECLWGGRVYVYIFKKIQKESWICHWVFVV